MVVAVVVVVVVVVVVIVEKVPPRYFKMSSLLLATRFIRPFPLMFSRPLGVKNTRPKVLYLLHASAGQ